MDFELRRKRVAEQIGNGIAIIPSAPVKRRNSDVHYPYRPDSDFYYLTGFDEPEAVAVIMPSDDSYEFVLFCRARDPLLELWDGTRVGPEGAIENHGAHQAFPISEIDSKMPELLEQYESIHYSIGRYPKFDDQVIGWLNTVKAKVRSGKRAPQRLADSAAILQEMRLFKDADELAVMKRCAEISAAAHCRAMRICLPGLYEYEIQAEIEHCFRRHGCDTAYPSIVAAGANACILHYIDNRDQLRDEELLLIDAGAEHHFYASDITRTFPINGKFSPQQREIYEIVLKAQKAAIASAKPGNVFSDVYAASASVIADGLCQLGLLSGTAEENLESGAIKKFYMHNVGHWLGMDVHDVGEYRNSNGSRNLEPGMCMTVEPGIYISKDADVPASWQGIGVRIEDDVFIKDGGCEVLTSGVPKEIGEIETMVGAG